MTATIFALAVSALFSVGVLRSVRRGRLSPRASLIWIAACALMLLVSASLPLKWLDAASHTVGIVYPPELLLVGSVLFLAVVLFEVSVAVAELRQRQIAIVQELGLLEAAGTGAASPEHVAEQPRLE